MSCTLQSFLLVLLIKIVLINTYFNIKKHRKHKANQRRNRESLIMQISEELKSFDDHLTASATIVDKYIM